MIVPHLENIDDLPDVVTGAFHYLFEGIFFNMKALLLANPAYSPYDGIFRGFDELQVEAVVDQ